MQLEAGAMTLDVIARAFDLSAVERRAVAALLGAGKSGLGASAVGLACGRETFLAHRLLGDLALRFGLPDSPVRLSKKAPSKRGRGGDKARWVLSAKGKRESFWAA